MTEFQARLCKSVAVLASMVALGFSSRAIWGGDSVYWWYAASLTLVCVAFMLLPSVFSVPVPGSLEARMQASRRASRVAHRERLPPPSA